MASYCNKCGGPIKFEKNENGKWVPRSIDGGDHWDECREWRIKGTHGVQDKDRGPDHIGPKFAPGHDTQAHLDRIGYDPTDTSIPFDPPYV